MRSTLRAGGRGVAPLFCVHPVTGRASDYAALAAALAWPGPIEGISAPDAPPDGWRLDELARRYCDELEPGAPALLLGWSIGGVIAAEMSRVVLERGGEVAFLGVIDGRAPQPEMRTRRTDREALARMFLNHAALTRELDPPAPPPDVDALSLLGALRAIDAATDIFDERELERRLAIFFGLVRALFAHDMQQIATVLHLFESSEAHPSHPKPATLGWEDVVPTVVCDRVPGTHFTLMSASRIPQLAELINRRLLSLKSNLGARSIDMLASTAETARW